MRLLRVFLPFAVGYFLSYTYRTVNAVIAPDLVRDLGIRADDLGLLTGAYLLTFALFQLPLGVLLDRYGPRRTEAVLLLFAALGAFTFALAESFGQLVAARALIGFGVSACLMAAFKAFVVWFPRERLPLVNGCQMAAGGLGVLAATTPTGLALDLVGWRGVFFVLAAATLLAAALIWLAVPEEERPRTLDAGGRGPLGGVVAVFRSGLFWRVAPLTVASQASFLSIQGLWSGPWLRDVLGLERQAAADHLLLVAAAMIGGFVGAGWIADRLARVGIPPLTVALAGMIAFMLTQVPIVFAWTDVAPAAWIGFGFFGTTGILPYAALSQRFPAALAGRLNTALNVLVFAAGFAAQWAIGAVVALWPAAAGGGYAVDGYRTAFGVMLTLQILALGWFVAYRRSGTPAG